MFGWFATLGATPRARRAGIDRRWLRIAPRLLAQALPALGCVLYLPRLDASFSLAGLPRGLVADDTLLTPILTCRGLCVATAITPEGPREWIECIDAEGRTTARLYLLPDTDYLAWDALLALAVPMVIDASARGDSAFVPTHARLLTFTLRHLGNLGVLGTWAPAAVSSIGRTLAGDIALTESVSL
jgi:hypothetical protein